MRVFVETNAEGVIMLNEDTQSNLSNKRRRQFLKELAGVTVLGGLASTATRSVKADVIGDKPEALKMSGYRETKHIQDYYDSL